MTEQLDMEEEGRRRIINTGQGIGGELSNNRISLFNVRNWLSIIRHHFELNPQQVALTPRMRRLVGTEVNNQQSEFRLKPVPISAVVKRDEIRISPNDHGKGSTIEIFLDCIHPISLVFSDSNGKNQQTCNLEAKKRARAVFNLSEKNKHRTYHLKIRNCMESKAMKALQVLEIEVNHTATCPIFKDVRHFIHHQGRKYEYVEMFDQPAYFSKTTCSSEDPTNVQEDSEDCVVCLTVQRDTILLPCKHVSVCSACAKVLGHSNGMCPLCRRSFTNMMTIRFGCGPTDTNEPIDTT